MRIVVAAKTDNETLADAVYVQGADVGAVDMEGTPGIFWAAKRGHRRMAYWLLRNGADPNARRRDDGKTALFAATVRGDLWMMRLLVEFGARGDWIAKRGSTVREPARAVPCKEGPQSDWLPLGAGVFGGGEGEEVGGVRGAA